MPAYHWQTISLLAQIALCVVSLFAIYRTRSRWLPKARMALMFLYYYLSARSQQQWLKEQHSKNTADDSKD